MTHRDRVYCLALVIILALNIFSVLSYTGTVDFDAFMISGRQALASRNPYETVFPDDGFVVLAPNLNPPISVPFFAALAAHGGGALRWFWTAANAVLYVLMCAYLLRRYPAPNRAERALWLLNAAGFWYALLMGQISVLLMALYLAALWALETPRPLWAAIPIGLLVAIKPNFAVWPALLFLAGHRRLGLATGAIVAMLWSLPVALYGPSLYAQWLATARAHSLNTWHGNSSLIGFLGRLGMPQVGTLLSIALLAYAATWAWRTRPAVLQSAPVGVSVALLSAPVAWPGYTLLLWPHLLATADQRARWLLLATLLSVPWITLIAAAQLIPALSYVLGSLYIVPTIAIGAIGAQQIHATPRACNR